MPKPEPISKHIVCSLCGMNWDDHGEHPGYEDCIALLKAKVDKQRDEIERLNKMQRNRLLQQAIASGARVTN